MLTRRQHLRVVLAMAFLGLGALLGPTPDRLALVQAEAASRPVAMVGDDRAAPAEISALRSATYLYVAGFTTAPDDPVLPCIGGQGFQSAWLSYTASKHGLLVFGTANEDTDYDTALAVWVEQPDGALRLVACATGPSGAGRAQVDVAAQPGETYLIEVVALQEGARWLKLWLHACSMMPLPPQPPGLCAYPGPGECPEPPYLVQVPVASK